MVRGNMVKLSTVLTVVVSMKNGPTRETREEDSYHQSKEQMVESVSPKTLSCLSATAVTAEIQLNKRARAVLTQKRKA